MQDAFALFCRQFNLDGSVVSSLLLSEYSLRDCVAKCLSAKRGRRPRTVSEFRSVSAKILRLCPEYADAMLSQLGAEHCELILQRCFSTARQRQKGHLILHGIFAFALRMRWCHYNPVDMLEKPHVAEREIELLSWRELQRLLRTARQAKHKSCLAALALMLWAGLRPNEVVRLEWVNLDWQERVVVVPAQHAKTGGCRHVSMGPALRSVLKEAGVRSEGKICPPDWGRKWKALRQAAGLVPWRQDVLRHCFASYHVKRWHDYGRLQAEMGHRCADLLRTRYLSMRGISSKQAAAFWQAGGLS